MDVDLSKEVAELKAKYKREARLLRAKILQLEQPQRGNPLSTVNPADNFQTSSKTLSQPTQSTREQPDSSEEELPKLGGRKRHTSLVVFTSDEEPPRPMNRNSRRQQTRKRRAVESSEEEGSRITPRPYKKPFHSAYIPDAGPPPTTPNPISKMTEEIHRRSLKSHTPSTAKSSILSSNAAAKPKPYIEDLGVDQKGNSPDFRADLNRRMGVLDKDKTKEGRKKRDRRRFVLEECLKRGLDLRSHFNSYPYETKMYPAIKWITSAAPPSWGWDRVVTKDVIRTLCWDRVRTMNRHIKEEKAGNMQNQARSHKGLESLPKSQIHTGKAKQKKNPAFSVSDEEPSNVRDRTRPPRSGPMPTYKAVSNRNGFDEGGLPMTGAQPRAAEAKSQTRATKLMPTRKVVSNHDDSDSDGLQSMRAQRRAAKLVPTHRVVSNLDDSDSDDQPSTRAQHRATKPVPTRRVVSDHDDSDKNEQLPLRKVPKTISRAPIPDISPPRPATTQNSSPNRFPLTSPAEAPASVQDMSSPPEYLHNAQKLPDLPQDDGDLFSVKIGKKITLFAMDIEWQEFDATVANLLTVESEEIRVYRAISGTKSDREWKPLSFSSELTAAVRKYGGVGIEVSVKKQVDYFNSEEETDSDTNSGLFEKPDAVNGGQKAMEDQQLEAEDHANFRDKAIGMSQAPASPPPTQVTEEVRSKRMLIPQVAGDTAIEDTTVSPIPGKGGRAGARKSQATTKKPVRKKVPVERAPGVRGPGRPRKVPVPELGAGDKEQLTREADNGKGAVKTRSGRLVKKSRLIRERDEYQEDVTHTDRLNCAKRQLKEDWKIFEAKNPPSYQDILPKSSSRHET